MTEETNQAKANLSKNDLPTGELQENREVIEGSNIVYPFGPYEILIKLSKDGRFVGVTEVRVNKDFRRYSQRISSGGQHNAEKFYEK